MTAAEMTQVFEERVPPHDIAAEQIALGALLVENAVEFGAVVDAMSTTDLYRPAHQLIMEAALALADAGAPVTEVSVHEELVRRGQSAATGGAPYLHELYDAVPVVVNGGYYARIVAAKAKLRRLIEAGLHAAQLGYAAQGEPDELAEQALAGIERAVAEGSAVETDTQRAADALPGFMDDLETPDAEGEITPPYADLAAVVPALRPGDLVTVAGRTAMGKSVVALDTARHAAIRGGHCTLVVSLEMKTPLLMRRIMAAEAKVPAKALERKQLSEAHWQEMARAQARVAEAPLYLSTPDGCTLGLIRARLRSLARTDPVKLLVVDHVGLMTTRGRTPESRQNEIQAYSQGLKRIAMEFDIPVLMVSQVNRAPESREDRVPRLSDLRDSGSLEQDSDTVLLVYRPDYYDPEDVRSGEVDIHVAKHRSGATGVATVAHQLHYQRFVDMARV
ncbi:replicative DNA helicase [Nocardiopsis potens]|uniref:replicative DNA helicase n=1 Tax=Nocardiopsis potens TaxID=1246458 RepID=UPI00036CF61B|nr:replicative DNA helicase [Nocardiopsis potens]